MTWRHAGLVDLHAGQPDLDQLHTTPGWEAVLAPCRTCGELLHLVST